MKKVRKKTRKFTLSTGCCLCSELKRKMKTKISISNDIDKWIPSKSSNDKLRQRRKCHLHHTRLSKYRKNSSTDRRKNVSINNDSYQDSNSIRRPSEKKTTFEQSDWHGLMEKTMSILPIMKITLRETRFSMVK